MLNLQDFYLHSQHLCALDVNFASDGPILLVAIVIALSLDCKLIWGLRESLLPRPISACFGFSKSRKVEFAVVPPSKPPHLSC